MTSILSSISGYFSKSLMLGAFLPAVIHIILGIFFFVPLLPEAPRMLKTFEALDTQWKVVAISFITIVLSGLLYNLNIPVIRLYEGYLWKGWWIGRVRTRRYQAEFTKLTLRASRLTILIDLFDPDSKVNTAQLPDVSGVLHELVKLSPRLQLSNSADGVGSGLDDRRKIYDILLDEWNRIKRRLNSEFPGDTSLILPTQLGNVIRSFEYYPDKEYRMDAIALWPRLVGVIDKEYAVSVDDAKTSFDFLLNLSVLSGLLSLAILCAGVANPATLVSVTSPGRWLSQIVVFVFLSYCFYRLSMRSAASWGGMVKGAFDLYRNKLLVSLGYGKSPATRAGEKALWDGISLQMLLGNSRSGPRVQDYSPSPPPASACTSPSDVQLELTRGFKRGQSWGEETVVVRVENVDTQGRVAEKVVLTETLPPGHDLAWGSASIGSQQVPVTGINPYRFFLGAIEAGGSRELTYRVILRKVIAPVSS